MARYIKDISLVFISASLLVASFPDFNLGLLAWFGLIPLLIAINGKSLKYGFFLSLICGMIFFIGIFYWILVIPKYTWLHHGLLAVYLGSYFGFFGLALNFISKHWGLIPALFSAPFIWVSLEYIRGNLSFLALPWTLLAHSQYQYPIVIQVASITGAYGVSFLIVLVNAAIAGMILGGKYRLKIPPGLPLPKRGIRTFLHKEVITPPLAKGDKGGFSYQILLLTTVLLLLITLIYGYFIVTTPISGDKVKISLVQGNIEQIKKWDPQFAREIRKIYAELTTEVAKELPALIVWPETATPDSITQNPFYFKEVREITKNNGTYLLLGSAQHQKMKKEPKGKKDEFFNSAFLIPPEPVAARVQVYNKIRLFPFGEYLPYRETIPWPLIKLDISSSDNYIPGKEFKVFQHPDFRFGVTICWENVFPYLVRDFVKRGAQCIINLTNEAHFGKTAAPHQLVAISVFRAVENRIYVIRCANTGVSCIIDPYGRIVDRIKDEKGQDTFIQGTITGWIIPLESKTIYTRYGDWFVWVTIVGSALLIFASFLKKRE